MTLHGADMGTGYSEVTMEKTRREDIMMSVLDEIWFYVHGDPEAL